MPDLLLELFSEEIPARMQHAAANELERLVVGALVDRGLLFDGARAFSGPRRLVLAVAGLPARQPDTREERKGPRVGAPEKALEGFLRAAGVTLDQCSRQSDGKGEFYVATIARAGRETAEVLADMLPGTIGKLSWPKSMRWTESTTRWVRPLRGIVCTFDGDIVPFEFAGIASGNCTFGHRFLSHEPIVVRRFEDYEAGLRNAFVILERAERKEIIVHEARQNAFALGLELIEDDDLLAEVSGLAEWPVVFIGRIEERFMDVPPEILQTSMRAHQKYFAVRDPKSGGLAARFIVVAGTVASDGGSAIIAGNERVLRARLSDAKFFWDQDRKRTLESRVEDLKNIVFHAKLGTQYERIKRIEKLAGDIAAKIGADVSKSRRAAYLCKADLTTGVVGEFPELQGVMGRYFALHDDEDREVADAIRDHYKPVGPVDAVPESPISICVALADKIDTLQQFFSIGQKPTGSGDPFALRRAALGIIRTVLSGGIRFPLVGEAVGPNAVAASHDLAAFYADRLKIVLKDRGIQHDLVDAVFAQGFDGDLVRFVGRVDALQAFLKTDDGANLLAGYRRAANILRIEEKKDNRTFAGDPSVNLFRESAEDVFWSALRDASEKISAQLAREDFVAAMRDMAVLRSPVDAFFETVKVNDSDGDVRENRLRLLSALRRELHRVADFSKIEG